MNFLPFFFLIFVFIKASASTIFYTGITESMHAYGKKKILSQ